MRVEIVSVGCMEENTLQVSDGNSVNWDGRSNSLLQNQKVGKLLILWKAREISEKCPISQMYHWRISDCEIHHRKYWPQEGIYLSKRIPYSLQGQNS